MGNKKITTLSLSLILNLILFFNVLLLIGLYINTYQVNKIIMTNEIKIKSQLKKDISKTELQIKKYYNKKDLSLKECDNIFLLNEIHPINIELTKETETNLKILNNKIQELKHKCLKKQKINYIKLKVKSSRLEKINKKLKEDRNNSEDKEKNIKVEYIKSEDINNKKIIDKYSILKNINTFGINNKNTLLKKKINLPIQKKNSNTCVIDNLAIILEYEYGFKVNKDLIYKKLGKQKGDYWHSGYFLINDKGGQFIEKEGFEDFKLLKEKSKIKTYVSSNINEFKFNLYKNKMLLMELPMEIIYPNIKKFKNTDLYHAITILSYDKKTNTIEYYNSLNGKFETLDFNDIKLNDKYLKYPFRTILTIN